MEMAFDGLVKAEWDSDKGIGLVKAGSNVGLVVNGSINCNGKTVSFKVFEWDFYSGGNSQRDDELPYGQYDERKSEEIYNDAEEILKWISKKVGLEII